MSDKQKPTPPPPKNWRFRVYKLGALIRGGEFEIKPLTLFCGENNSGKTWAMYATYGFLRIRSLPYSGLLHRFLSEKINQKRISYKAFLEEKLESIIARGNKAMVDMLPAFFNVNKELLSKERIEWNPDRDSLIRNAVHSGWQSVGKTSEGTVTIIKESNAEDIKIVADGKVDLGLVQHSFPLFSTLIDCEHVFLMPAERSGLNLLFHELSSRRTALLHNVNRKDPKELLRNVNRTSYAEPIADYLDWLNKIYNRKGSFSYSKTADFLETKIVGGKYRVDEYGNISFAPLNAKGEYASEMGLHATSSAVKSMFGLWYYLRYDARPGHVVMIDEPELNLHPARQKKFARFLAQLVMRGLYVVASTHSDHIVREINTLIMLNEKDPKKSPKRASLMKRYKISEREILNPDIVGAYEMSAQSGRIEPMEMEADGINAKTLDDIIVAQGKENDEVYYSLEK